MSQIIDVATWVALITGIVGISLSGVAIWFTFRVESRSRRVNEQMIQSLQKIESYVERSSTDTKELIKVGWDRMLGGVGLSADQDSQGPSESSMKKITEGLAEELKAEIRSARETGSGAIDEDRIVQRVSEAIQAQIRAGRSEVPRPRSRMEEWARILGNASSPAYEIVRILLKYGHMTADEYNRLQSTYLAQPLSELRREGVLVPLVGYPESGEEALVYWFPPDEGENLRIAFELINRQSRRERARVRAALENAGYIARAESELSRDNNESTESTATSQGPVDANS